MQQTLQSIRKTALVDKQPDAALDMIQALKAQAVQISPGEQVALAELEGLALMRVKRYDDASGVFSSVNNQYLAGYAQLLKGDLQAATVYWKPLLTERPNHWCLVLYGMASATLNLLPTFLQLRNHLEADIGHLWRAEQYAMLDNVLHYVEVMADINYESYKFVGRALLNVSQFDRAESFLMKGQRILPNDPEVYYHLGQYYNGMEQPEEATLMLRQCCLISPTYTPAVELLSKLTAKAGIQ